MEVCKQTHPGAPSRNPETRFTALRVYLQISQKCDRCILKSFIIRVPWSHIPWPVETGEERSESHPPTAESQDDQLQGSEGVKTTLFAPKLNLTCMSQRGSLGTLRGSWKQTLKFFSSSSSRVEKKERFLARQSARARLWCWVINSQRFIEVQQWLAFSIIQDSNFTTTFKMYKPHEINLNESPPEMILHVWLVQWTKLVKGIVYLKMNIVIIYSPPSCSKRVSMYMFYRIQKYIFWRMKVTKKFQCIFCPYTGSFCLLWNIKEDIRNNDDN